MRPVASKPTGDRKKEIVLTAAFPSTRDSQYDQDCRVTEAAISCSADFGGVKRWARKRASVWSAGSERCHWLWDWRATTLNAPVTVFASTLGVQSDCQKPLLATDSNESALA